MNKQEKESAQKIIDNFIDYLYPKFVLEYLLYGYIDIDEFDKKYMPF
jgi:hypothetical protein